MDNIENQIINIDAKLIDVLKKLNRVPETLTLFIVDDRQRLAGSLTDGDLRRGFINGLQLDSPLENFINKNCYYIKENQYNHLDMEKIRTHRLQLVPMVDENLKIIKIYNFRKMKSILPVDAVIMAGGEGRRLRPLTEKKPKPLLDVGGKPIIEYNINRLLYFGIDHIHLTLKYLGNMIEQYCQEKNFAANLYYHYEEAPMGTIGAVKAIGNFTHEHILISNSDVLTNIDYEDMYKEFIAGDADILVASVPYNINLPYAILETKTNAILSFKEKPEYTYYANSGIYMLKREVLNLIPGNTRFDATDLMEKLLNEGGKLKHYPIRTYWLDIGKKEDYEKAQLDVAHIDFN